MDMTFCVLWIKENRKLSLYHQNQELGVISKSRLSSKMWQYRAFQSHNKKRNKKTSTAHCLNNVLVLSTGSSPLLSHSKNCSPLCLLLADGQLEDLQTQQLGPFHSRAITKNA